MDPSALDTHSTDGVAEHHEVIVVGGGQAGLALGYYLAGQGRDFVILEAEARPAAAWRKPNSVTSSCRLSSCLMSCQTA